MQLFHLKNHLAYMGVNPSRLIEISRQLANGAITEEEAREMVRLVYRQAMSPEKIQHMEATRSEYRYLTLNILLTSLEDDNMSLEDRRNAYRNMAKLYAF